MQGYGRLLLYGYNKIRGGVGMRDRKDDMGAAILMDTEKSLTMNPRRESEYGR